MTLQDASGLYYYADQADDNSWVVSAQVGRIYLKNLPKGWENMKLSWERDARYGGVFRSLSSSLEYCKDGRAILNKIATESTVEAYAKLTIWMWQPDFTYAEWYSCLIDFSTISSLSYPDKLQTEYSGTLKAGTLDGDLHMLLETRGGVQYNMPFWEYDSATSSFSTVAKFLAHTGIKLLYSSKYEGATVNGSPLHLVVNGFNQGIIGSQLHTIPAMTFRSETQANGATTFIGNQILTNDLITGNQGQYNNEGNYKLPGQSQPFTQRNNLIHNNLKVPVELNFKIEVAFSGTWSYNYPFFSGFRPNILFALFECTQIDGIDVITERSLARLDPIILAQWEIGGFNSSGSATYVPPTNTWTLRTGDVPHDEFVMNANPITLKPNHSYTFALLYDFSFLPASGVRVMPSGNTLDCTFSNLSVTLFSAYNGGAAAPVSAPQAPPNAFPCFTPAQVLDKLVKSLNSERTNNFGFPVIPSTTPYAGVSDYLEDTLILPGDNYDNVPRLTFFTSESALQNLPGQPFLSMSINDFFQSALSMWGCGMGIENDATTGDPTVIRIEPMAHFYDASTEIFDLQDNVSAPVTKELAFDLMCSTIEGGYGSQSLNNVYGVDSPHAPQSYNSPLKNANKKESLVNTIIANPYYEENSRQRQATSPLPVSAANSNGGTGSSGGNSAMVFEVGVAPAYELPDVINGITVSVATPDNIAYPTEAYGLQQYPTAQCTDPTAASAPYFKGYYYPDAMINNGITPRRNLMRNGAWLHGLFDGQESKFISFVKQYQMLFNGTAVEKPSISSNIDSGLLDEVGDIAVSDLAAKLFRPWIFNVTTKVPINAYALINNNPRGYIKFTYGSRTYKGFIMYVEQSGINSPVQLKLLAHPETTDADLRAI
jgi:hypothetical protein